MRIILSASSGNTGRIIGDVARALGSGGGGLAGVLAGVGIAVVAATAAVGIFSVKMAGDFQQAILTLVSHAGLARDQINAVSQAVLAMAPTVGRSPIDLANALYPILSAFSGITNESAKTRLALDTLKMSFETVAGTEVNGTAVANAAVGTFNALGLATNNVSTNTQRMKNLFDVMDKTVQMANTNWDMYKNVVAKVATSANTAGVSFNESQAALATLTSQGMSAMKAGTYLVNTFNTLEIKTNLLATHAKKLGISFDQQKYSAMDLADKLKYLNEITGGNSQKLLALMGNNSTALQTFKKLSTGVQTYRADLDALNHSQGALASSFDTATQGFNFHIEQLKAAFGALFITIGTNLLPVLSQFLSAVTPLVVNFSKFISSGQAANTAMSIFHTVMSTVMSVVAAVTPFFMAVWSILQGIGSYLAAIFKPVWDQLVAVWQSQLLPALKQLWDALQPLMPLFIGIGAVILGVVVIALGVLFGVLTGLIKALAYVLSAVVQVFGGIVKIISGAVQVIAGIIRFFVDLFTGNFKQLGNDLKVIWNGIVLIFQGAWDVISGIFKAAWGAISGFVGGLVQGIIGFFQHLASVLVGHSIVPDLINAIVQWFANLPGRALSAVGSLLGQLAGFFGNLASQAISWGANIIGGVIGGIQSMAGALFSAVGTTIHNALASIPGVAGHVPGFASGVTNFAGGYAVVGERGPELVYMPQGSSVYPQVNRSGGSSGAGINIYISTLAGSRSEVERMADLIEQELGRRFRGQTPGYASGGVFG